MSMLGDGMKRMLMWILGFTSQEWFNVTDSHNLMTGERQSEFTKGTDWFWTCWGLL